MAFDFNENGICLNPNIFFKHEQQRGTQTIVTTAKCGDEWYGAYDCSYKDTGASCGVSGLTGKRRWLLPHPTEEAAAIQVIKYLLHADATTWYQVNSPQATAALKLRLNQLTGRIGVQASLF
jgi:hypothetical protein